MPLTYPPLPPRKLRSITGPTQDAEFLGRGLEDLSYLLEVYAKHVPLPRCPLRVLDFGCGCGRLSRHLGMLDDVQAFGSDANTDHVAWCAKNLPNVDTRQNQFYPPLSFDEESMDFVYALSVFTHLPHDAAVGWFRELARVLTQQGILIATTHGYPALATIKWSDLHQKMFRLSRLEAEVLIQELEQTKYIHLPYERDVLALANVGDDYGNTFIDPNQASSIWDGYFELIQLIPGGKSRDWQDVLVLRKR